MKPVEQVSNWGFWDVLDGKRLEEGERLRVRWPDGSETVETCRVQKAKFRYEDHGHPGEGPDDHAFVALSAHGAVGTVRLRQAGILCERVPQ